MNQAAQKINDIQIEETHKEGLARQLRVSIGGAEIAQRLDAAMRKLMPTVELKGFRKGHVPLAQIKQRYGEELLADIVSDVIAETSSKALKDKSLDAVIQPSVRIESDMKAMLDGEDLKYQMSVEVAPDFTPVNVETLELERIAVDLAEEDVNAALQNIAERNRIFEDADADRAAEKGDMAIIDIAGLIDGKPFEGNESKNMRVILGEGQIAENFEKALAGKKSSAMFNVPMGFPPDHENKTLAGKLADFEIAVKSVHAPRTVQIDDVFAKAMGAKDVEDLRQNVRAEMTRADDNAARSNMKQQISQAMLKHEFALPPTLVAYEQEGLKQQIDAMRQQMPENEKPNLKKLEQNIKDMAEKRVRVALVLSRIARDKKIEITADTLRQAIEEDIRRYPGKPEQIRKIYQDNPEAVQKLHAKLMEEKTIDEIIKSAQIKEKKITRKELYNMDDKQSLTDKPQ